MTSSYFDVCVQVVSQCSTDMMKLVTVEQSCRVLTSTIFRECNSVVGNIYTQQSQLKCWKYIAMWSLLLLLMLSYWFLWLCQVDPEPYWDICTHDTCSCPSVGDCACFCNTIAAYAHECAQKGLVVNWRSNDLCRKFNPPKCGFKPFWLFLLRTQKTILARMFIFLYTIKVKGYLHLCNLQCIQVIHFLSVCVFPGNWTHNLLRC